MTRRGSSDDGRWVASDPSFGRALTMFGVFFVVIGLILMLAGKLPWIGKLPGDLFIRRGNLQIYVPLGTSLILSLLLSLVLRLFRP
jgi:hypothetical protein